MAETKTEPGTALQNAVDRINKLSAGKAEKLAELYREKTSVQNSIEAWETEAAELQQTAAGASVEDISRNIDRQTELNTQITKGKEKIRMLNAQIEYSQTEENFLEFDEYNSLMDELRSGYEEIKRVELLQAQQYADSMTSCGETIAQAQADAQGAADAAFNMYHGFTRFRTKIEHRCVGDEPYTVTDDATGKTHTRIRNIYKDFEVPDNSRIHPVIGESSDITEIRRVAEAFNTRGENFWRAFSPGK